MPKLRGRVVVVTGASSGLGRETAVQFARFGCHVVVTARREQALNETLDLCRAAGGSGQVVVADVTREDDMARVVQAALAYNGAIDVWVNNAGVTLFGSLDRAPFEEHRRVIEVNLFGPILGARAVLPVFRRQRRGIMINVGSILSKVAQPFVPSYVISKYGLRGLTDALRAELAEESDIHVCGLYAYAMDTEHFQAGANRVGRPAHPMPPLQSPEKVARAIVRLARRPRRQRNLPRYAWLAVALHELMPRTTERVFLRLLGTWHFGDIDEAHHQGNLFGPIAGRSAVHGDRRPRLGTASFVARAIGSFFGVLAGSLVRPVLPRRESARRRPPSRPSAKPAPAAVAAELRVSSR